MPDFSANTWSEVDASNSTPPTGLPTGALPSTLSPTTRGFMGATVRFWRRINPFYITTGTATALALTFSQAPASYVTGERFAFRPNIANTGSVTLNINGLGAKQVLTSDGVALAGGELAVGQMTEVWFDGASFRIIGSPVGKNPSFTSVTISGGTAWHSNNDGVGSGLDADLLDAQQGSYYLNRANHTGTQPASTITGLDALLAAAAPTASVIYTAASTAPTGYLAADGSAVSRTTYANLFAAIGTTYGIGNGSSTFNLPDLRGEFIRGLDSGRGVDSGRTLGSAQSSQNLAHTHTGTTSSDTHSHTGTTSTTGAHTHAMSVPFYAAGGGQSVNNLKITSSTGQTSAAITTASAGDHSHTFTTSSDSHNHTLTTNSDGGTEARPRNVALLACIKT
jgi:microcystin-dependent protein